MKSRSHKLRLGSFELLEPRAMLAHAGLDHGLFLPQHEMRNEQHLEFVSLGRFSPLQREGSPAGRLHSISAFDAPRGDHGRSGFDHGGLEGGPRRGDRMVNDPAFEYSLVISAPTIVYLPTTPVIVFISVPLPTVALSSFSPPPTISSVSNSVRPPQASSPLSGSSNSFLAESPRRTTNTGRSALDSLSLVSTLALRRAENEMSTGEESDVVQRHSDRDETRSDSNDGDARSAALPPQDPEATILAVDSAVESNDKDADLIELTTEEPLTRGKRKAVRRTPTAVLDTTLHAHPTIRQQLGNDQLRPWASEIWRQTTEATVEPANDDLIELLASDAASWAAKSAPRAPSFESDPAPQLEATLGYFQAPELNSESLSPVAVQPAAVAAATLPVPVSQ